MTRPHASSNFLVLLVALALNGASRVTVVAEPCAGRLTPLQPSGEACLNGLAGISGSNSNGSVCCSTECLQCGGAGCGSFGEREFDGTSCCIGGILDTQPDCSISRAAPCVIVTVDDATTAEQIFVSPNSALDLTSVFSCEGGEFDVFWSGVVNVPGTIYVGSGTTVRIFGEELPAGGIDMNSSANVNFSDQQRVEALSTRLPPLPNSLNSAAVSTASQHQKNHSTSTTSSGGGDTLAPGGAAGPVFFVDGGQLFLERLAVRGGIAANYTEASSSDGSGGSGKGGGGSGSEAITCGGGVHAVDANVTVAGCEFEDNFSEYLGGGIFTNRSTLVVTASVFRRCQADVESFPGEDAIGAGGGIGVESTNVLIDGCLFDSCYASKKGGGFHQEDGYVSVINSLFYNNVAGSTNEEAEDPVGEGGAMSFIDCHGSFDGLADGGANDTVVVQSHTAKKGGAIVIWSKSAPSQVEFRRLTVENTTTGEAFKDDPQGQGAGFAIGTDTTLSLTDSVFLNNVCGEKGGVINMGNGEDWEEGPVVILRNCTFMHNQSGLDNGGVANLGRFGRLVVQGDENVFAYNRNAYSGAVFAATTNTNITIEGGEFFANEAEKGPAIWTKGEARILGGNFRDNVATVLGGVVFASDESSVTLSGGVFEGNRAIDGGVAYVLPDGALSVEGGVYSGNVAAGAGGAFYASEDGSIEITGGSFFSNEADFGGFLYKQGGGRASCQGSSVIGNRAVDGGGVYIVHNATLDWACDLGENSALSGPAIYVREGSTVNLRGMMLFGNVATTGSVVFVVTGSKLRTYQVVFNDTLGGAELSAVQVDRESSYKAEDTSFLGFYGEAVVYSQGILYLDDCDFSGSLAPVLVRSEGPTPVIRNAILGDNNHFDQDKRPRADSLINVDVTCDGWAGKASGPSSTQSSPCSEGSLCLDGDLGVYCPCYVRESTMEQVENSTYSRQDYDYVYDSTCISGEVDSLRLTAAAEPVTTFYPSMVEGCLVLSLDTDGAIAPATAATASTSYGGADDAYGQGNGDAGGGSTSTAAGVVWNVSTSSVFVNEQEQLGGGLMAWTVTPSTGLLLPGQSVTIFVTTLPSNEFDGLATVSFEAKGMSPSSAADDDAGDGGSDGDEHDQNIQVASVDETSQGAVSFDVAFFHCEAGQVWNWEDSESGLNIISTTSSSGGGSNVSCEPCIEVVKGNAEGLDCSAPGATTRALPIKPGFWRASLDSLVIRECFNKDACKGGSGVADVAQYCNDGYEGPQCARCALGYGDGVAHTCHECTPSFKTGVFVAAILIVLAILILTALLVVYLVGGRGAVSTTINKTKRSVSFRSRRYSRNDDDGYRLDRLNSSRTDSARTAAGDNERSKRAGGGKYSASEACDALGATAVVSEGASAPPLTAERSGSSTTTSNTASSRGLRSTTTNTNKRTAAARITAVLVALPLSKLKIVVVVWQISSAFAEITKAPFPPVYQRFLSFIGIFSFDLSWLLSAACLVAGIGFYDKLLAVTIGPVVVLCLLGLTFLVGSKIHGRDKGSGSRNCIHAATTRSGRRSNHRATPSLTGSTRPFHSAALGRPAPAVSTSTSSRRISAEYEGARSRPRAQQDHLWDLFARHTTMVLIMLYLVYTQVSTVLFSTFACEHFPEIGKSYLRADFDIECYTAKHKAYQIYSAVMICIYPIGIPVAFCYFLVRQRSRINPPVNTNSGHHSDGQRILEQKIRTRDEDPAITPTYFLWAAFLPNRYYYEVLECFRRLLLTGALVFVRPDTPGQVAFGCIFAFLSLMVFELLRPHIDSLERHLYRTGCLLIFFSNFLALTIKAEVASPTSSGSAVYSVVLVVVNALFFMAVFVNTWATTKDAVANHDMTDFVLGISVRGEPLPPKVKTRDQSLGEKKVEDDADLEAAQAWDV